MRRAFLLFPLALLPLLSACDRPDSEPAFEDRMHFVIRVFSEFDDGRVNEVLADQQIRAAGGQPGHVAAARVKGDYLRVRDELKGRALTTPPPATAETPQPLHTEPVPRDPQGLWLILWLAVHKGNSPAGGDLTRTAPSRAVLSTPIRFHFETTEYRRYPDHTPVPLPVSPFGTLACFQTGLAIVPPRTVPARVVLNWEFVKEGERWQLERITLDEKAIEWVEDRRPL